MGLTWAWGAARKKGVPGAEGGSPGSWQTKGDRGARAEGALLGRFWGDTLGRAGARGRAGLAWAGAGSLEPVWTAREPPGWGESEGETPVGAGGGPRCGRTEGAFRPLGRLRVTCEWGQHRPPQSSVFSAVCDVKSHSKCLSEPGGIRLRARGWVGGSFRKRICSRHPCELVTLAPRGGCGCDCREGQTHHHDPLLPACCALEKSWEAPHPLLPLFQVLLSGLIGVVSWKRPLSLVVSGTRVPMRPWSRALPAEV